MANVQSFGQRLGLQADVKVWGLSLDQMNSYSSPLSSDVGLQQFRLIIEAGDVDEEPSVLMDGSIVRSYVDLSGAPDSLFSVSVAGIYDASLPMASQSLSGARNAEDLISSICAAANLTLDNSAKAHFVLRNMVTYGSAIDQIDDICNAAGFSWKQSGTTIILWPGDGNVDDEVIDVGPSSDPIMVGYPEWWQYGIVITSLFNQRILVGRRMNVTSLIPKANGLWNIIQVQHSLSTMLDKGPWFTTAILSKPS